MAQVMLGQSQSQLATVSFQFHFRFKTAEVLGAAFWQHAGQHIVHVVMSLPIMLQRSFGVANEEAPKRES